MSVLDVNLEDRAALEVALPALMIVAGELAEKAGELLIFGKFDLTVAKYGLLTSLAHVGRPLSMTDLKESAMLPRSASHMTQMVDDLEARGLVRRLASPSDRRVWMIEITDAGRALLTAVDEQYAATMRSESTGYSTEDLRVTVEVLRRFITEAAGEVGLDLGKMQHEPR